MKRVSTFTLASCICSILMVASLSAGVGESSIVDRKDGVALRLNIHPSTGESGNRSLLISIALTNEGSEVWRWMGEKRHKVGNTPQLREIFLVSLRDREGKQCELTLDGQKLLSWPEDEGSGERAPQPDRGLKQRKGVSIEEMMTRYHRYSLEGDESFHWQIDLLKCFELEKGDYEVTIEPVWRNATIDGGRTVEKGGSPDVRIAGKRVAVPGPLSVNPPRK